MKISRTIVASDSGDGEESDAGLGRKTPDAFRPIRGVGADLIRAIGPNKIQNLWFRAASAALV